MKKTIIMTMLMVLTAAVSVYAADLFQAFESQPGMESDVENVWNNGRVSDSSTTAPSATVVSMDGQVSETPVKAISIEAVYSDNVQTYNIPLSYGFPLSLTGNKELLNLKMVVPYTRREIGTFSDSGLGDISLTTNYLIRFEQLLLDSKLVIKAPTGEFEDADVPLGTGSTDVGLFVNGTWYMDSLILKGGLGYSYNGDYELNGDKVTYGDEYLISAGADYKINDTMKAGGQFLYKSRAEDELVIFGAPSYHAGLNSLDFIPNFTYFYAKYNVEMTLTATIPVSDSWNSDKGTDPTEDPDRSASISFSASKPF